MKYEMGCGCSVEVTEDTLDATIFYCPKHTVASQLYEELKEADRVICDLCKRLNPQHATMDYGKGCEWCQERESRLQTLGVSRENKEGTTPLRDRSW